MHTTQQARVGRLVRVAARKKPFLSCQRGGLCKSLGGRCERTSAGDVCSFLSPAYAAVEQPRIWTLSADVDSATYARFLF